MLYTLLKFLGWGALLAFVGGCIGWALRALKCRGEIALAKSATVDDDEVERMRHRLANLEQVVAERDRLRIQLADVRHADSPGIVGAEVPVPSVSEPQPEADLEPESWTDAEADTSGREEVGEAVGDETPSIVPDADNVDEDEPMIDSTADIAGLAEIADVANDDEPSTDPPTEALALDLAAAASELGKKITLDDLTVVEGIGPKISELCSGIGLTTWRQLADADVDDLQSMLDAAGSRYTVHKPGTWPRQAELLASGRWADFKTLTDRLDRGK